MEKLIKLVGIVMLLMTSISYGHLDTLSNFNDMKGITYYRGNSNTSFCARFDLSRPCNLISFSVILTGNTDEDGIKVRIFGYEGGISAPILEKDLIDPIIVFKKQKGIEKIETEIPSSLVLKDGQFFISLEDLNPNVYLLSDIVAKKASCTDKYGEKYFVQLIKSIAPKGEPTWNYGNFGFAISCVVEYIPQRENLFEEIESHQLTLDSTKNKFNAAFIDYNNDAYIDILINGRLFLNQGNFKFLEEKDFLGYKTSAQLNFITDVNNDELPDILLLGCDSAGAFSNNTNKVFKRKSEGKYEYLPVDNFDSQYINSFTMLDYNQDGISDILYTKSSVQSDTVDSELLLKSDDYNSFRLISPVFNSDNKKSKLRTKVLLFDYNYDGLNDLIVNNLNCFPDFYRNNFGSYVLDESYTNETMISNKFFSYNLESADIENDGFPDLIPALEYKRSSLKNLLYNIDAGYNINDRGNIINFYNYKLRYEDSYQGLIIGDINNDSFSDLITLPNNLCHQPTVYLNNNGNFESVPNSGLYGDNLGNEGILIDLNNDMMPDILTINENGVKIFKNNGNLRGNSIKFKTNSKNYNQFINSTVDLYFKGTKITHKFSSTSGFLIQKPLEFIAGIGNSQTIDSVSITTQYKNKFKRLNLYDININLQKEIILDYSDFTVSENLFSDIGVYPNPFADNVTIEALSPDNCNYNFQIFNYLGEIVFEKESNSKAGSQIKLIWESGKPDFKNYTGVYYYKFKICDKQFTGKLIKVN